jgi:hypothetical protein
MIILALVCHEDCCDGHDGSALDINALPVWSYMYEQVILWEYQRQPEYLREWAIAVHGMYESHQV